MNSKSILLTASLMTLLFTFQNCSNANSGSIEFASASKEGEQGSSSGSSQQGTPAPTQGVPAAGCIARNYEWQVGTQRCSAAIPALVSSVSNVVVFDTLAPTTGQVSLRCTNGSLAVAPMTTSTCTTPPAAPVVSASQVRADKTSYTVLDNQALVYTTARVTEVVYACIQSRSDGSFPCVNGNVASVYFEVPRPAQYASPNQELIWSSGAFFAIPGIDFVDYEIYIARKNANGQLSEILGSTRLPFRLPVESLTNSISGNFRSSSGPNVFSYQCAERGSTFAIPNDYRRYDYFNNPNKDCYYKISN